MKKKNPVNSLKEQERIPNQPENNAGILIIVSF